MPNIKTAISVDENIFRQAEEVARSLNVSRSRAFAMAMEEFAKRRKSEQITQQLNEVYAEGPDAEEQELLRRMQPTHRRIAGPEW